MTDVGKRELASGDRRRVNDQRPSGEQLPGTLYRESQSARAKLVQLDTSDTVVNWVKSSKYSLVDVNILRQFPTQYAQVSYLRSTALRDI
jgi:hypothetical protein